MERFNSRNQTKFVRFSAHQCKACWLCMDKCPKSVIGKVSFLWHKHAVLGSSDECIGCMKCVKVCPVGAFSPVSPKRK